MNWPQVISDYHLQSKGQQQFIPSEYEKVQTILKGLLVTSFALHLNINAQTLNLAAMTTAAV